MGEQRYFEYDEQAIAYLKARDERLAEAIDAIGPVRREVTPAGHHLEAPDRCVRRHHARGHGRLP